MGSGREKTKGETLGASGRTLPRSIRQRRIPPIPSLLFLIILCSSGHCKVPRQIRQKNFFRRRPTSAVRDAFSTPDETCPPSRRLDAFPAPDETCPPPRRLDAFPAPDETSPPPRRLDAFPAPDETCPHPALRATFPRYRGKAKLDSVIFRNPRGVSRDAIQCHSLYEEPP